MSRDRAVWTDQLGRTYEYTPYSARPIAEAPVEFSSETTLALAEASRALGSVPRLSLTGAATVLYRSESSASSLIEGVGPGPRRILEAEVAGDDEIHDEQARRVVANLDALRDAMSTPIPAASGDLLRWHGRLMRDHPGVQREHVGAYRSQQNWIGGDAFGPRDAAFIPPGPDDVEPLIRDLVSFCGRTDLTPVAHAGIVHARFEVIHPFVDGNGRVGRLLLQQVLLRRSEIESPVPISVPWSQNRDRYIDGLRAYQQGDVDAWLQFVSLSVINAVDWMSRITEHLSNLVDDYRRRIGTRGRSVTARVIDDLPDHPIVDTQMVAQRYQVTPQTAHSALVRLEKAGILGERTFARRKKGRPRRAFAATELIDLLAGSLTSN